MEPTIVSDLTIWFACENSTGDFKSAFEFCFKHATLG